MSLTDDQRRAVRASVGVAVTAGAGTGKTHTLGHRFLHHLECGLSPLQVVAVTFTERAAFELRARVRRYLREHPDPPGGARAVVELEAAQISTLHALAARICRDHPDAAGVPPDFAVLGALEGRAWFQEQLASALSVLPSDLLARVPFPAVADAMERLLADPVIAERALAHGPEAWRGALERARREAMAELLASEAWRAATATLRGVRGREGDRLEEARRNAEHGVRAIEEGRVEEGVAAMASVDLRGGRKDAWPPGAREETKAALKRLRAVVSDAAQEGLITLALGDADRRWAEALPGLREAFARTRERLDEAKRRQRVLDFGDLEAHALRALEREEVRAHYASRWRALLVDEFQDTNPVQEALLERLAHGAELTIVGDEKQGIYGFRGADVAVFRRVRGRIEAAGGAGVSLSRSFRSHARLVADVNALAAPLLGPLHQDLQAQRGAAPHDGPYVEAAAVVAERGVTKPARQVAEARWIAQRIRALRDAGVRVEGEHGPRPVRFGDVAVLARSWRPLDAYAELLPALGVPAVHAGGGDLLATREAQDGESLLRFLADPHDDLALVALLRSPFFAVDDATLQWLAARAEADDPEGGWWGRLVSWARAGVGAEAPTGAEAHRLEPPEAPLARAHRVLRNLLERRGHSAPTRLLLEANAATGYGAVLANLPGARRREADWRGFGELVRELEAGHEDVFTVVRRLRRIRRAGVEAPRPTLEAGDAVTLTTVHRSKGLEWPVVVVADLDGGGGGAAPPVRIDPEIGIAAEPRGEVPGETVRPALLTLLEARSARAREEEDARVLYVAMTRARDRLLLTGSEPDQGAWKVLAPGLAALATPVTEIPYTPEAGRWPDAPPPPEVRARDEGSWRSDPRAVGVAPRAVAGGDASGAAAAREHADASPEEATGGAPTAGRAAGGAAGADLAWAAARLHLEDRRPEWLPLVDALRGASLPAPDLFDVELTRGGEPSGLRAPLGWSGAGPPVLLADADAPGRDAVREARLVAVDPSEPRAALSALRNELAPEAAPG